MNDYKRIHFIGIGGSGMSGLAGFLLQKGKKISGSDAAISPEKRRMLQHNNISALYDDHAAEHIDNGTDAVIYSLAIPNDNPERIEAHKRGIICLSYPEAIGELTKLYRTIAVCGTHGKTTVTSMIAQIFIEHNFDPQVIVGSEIAALEKNNFRAGKGNLFILEACEYQEAFLNYHPSVIVLNTLDPDHFDYYKTYDHYLDVFKKFTQKLPRDGCFFGNTHDEDVDGIMQELQKSGFPSYNMFTYNASGEQNTDYKLVDNDVFYKTEKLGTLELQIPGAHNRSNALAAFSVAHHFGITAKDILSSLKHFTGAHRRFEIKGSYENAVIIDDYAHHPVEIKATLQAVREKYPKARVCAVFQPHQFSRTHALLEEFKGAFKDADLVIVPNIYAARDTEEDKAKISAESLVESLNKAGVKTLWGQGIEETLLLLQQKASDFDVIITMGAGDIWKISSELTKG